MKNFPLLIISVLFIFIMISSCDIPQGGMYEDQKEYVEHQQPKLSPSEKETKFINKLDDKNLLQQKLNELFESKKDEK